ncbi:unannotated protein [freshwater metagenome]|uniref:Unannotated protein n=1 Tax=freshwater metagenome TaxID=449393 RepID=A0A6J6XCS6_9ZZZZ
MAGKKVRVEIGAVVDKASAGAFGDTHEGMGQGALVLRVDVGSDQGLDRLSYLSGDLANCVVEFVVGLAASAEKQQERVVVVSNPTEVGLKAELGHVFAARGAGRRCIDRGQQTLADRVEQRQIEVSLRVEVLIHHRLRHACGIGDVVHRCAVITLPCENLQRDVEQLLAAGRSGKTDRHRGDLRVIVATRNMSGDMPL